MSICKLAARIAVNYQDDEALSDAAIAGFMIDPADGSEPRIWATETVKAIRDPQTRRDAEQRLGTYIEAQQTNETEAATKRHFSVEEARQVYENMAEAMGINLADPKDKISQVVRIGLKDLDPSRVLRNCERIFLSISFQGLIAEWLQLPTAGGKVVHCDLHGHAAESLDLDVAYSGFKKLYCEKCPDCSPRPSTWVYSQEWQEEENKKHEQFMMDFDRRTGRTGGSD
jgi:hypothetical protein